MTEINQNMFEGCIGIEAISLPDSIEQIDKETFKGCTSLRSVRLPENLRIISSGLFENCASLKEITVPAGVVGIMSRAFKDCESLERVDILGEVKSLGEKTFENCKNLTYIELPESVESIYNTTFDGCDRIPDIYERFEKFKGEELTLTLTAGVQSALVSDERGNNMKINCDAVPEIAYDSFMTPVRIAAEFLGAEVIWDEVEQSATIIGNDKNIKLIIDSDIAQVNGVEKKINSPAYMKNDRTYIPLRFIVEELGGNIDWIEGEDAAVISG